MRRLTDAKTTGLLAAAICLFCVGASAALADGLQAEEAHRARHGGLFGDADDLYHYELLVEAGGRLVLYVNDENNRPLNVGNLSGRWTLNPDSEEALAGVLSPSADGAYFTTVVPGLSLQQAPVIQVEVLKNGVWAAMEFPLPPPSPAE